MQIEWVRFDRERYNPRAFAAVRQGAREGTLLDVATDQIFIALLLRNLRESLTVEENDLRLEFRPTSRFADKPIRQPGLIRAVDTEQSNSTALVDNDYVVKVYRKLERRHQSRDRGRSLPDRSRRLCQLAGAARQRRTGRRRQQEQSAIAVVHAFVENQGDGWTVTSAYLDRFIDEQRLLTKSEHPGEKRGTGALSALHVADRTAGRRNASRAREPRRHRRFCAGADHAGRRQAPDRRGREPRRAHVRHPEAAARQPREADRQLVDRLLAERDRLARPPERVASAATSTASTSVTTAISISARC